MKLYFFLLSICFYSVKGQVLPCIASSSDGSGGIYEFSQTGQTSLSIYEDVQETVWWSFFVSFCVEVQNVQTNVTAQPDTTYWEGWNMGSTMITFAKTEETPYDFYQLYSGGDLGYPCPGNGRQTEVFIYCGSCPVGQTCYMANETTTDDFCICGVNYDDKPSPNVDICVAQINMSVACPSVVYPAPVPPITPITPTHKLSGGQIFGVVLLVIVILTSMSCILGYIYNTKIHNKSGVNALPGYDFFSKERRGMEKFKGTAYQRTTGENQYGTL